MGVGDEHNSDSAEVTRLRALGAWMREVGATELGLGDLHIKLSPKPPAAPGRATSDALEHAALLDEAREENKLSDAEAAHNHYWRRITRSSGAPIPAYRPKAERPA